MSDRPDDGIPDWIERVVAVAGAIGMNRVRVRWKLQRQVNAWRARRNQRANARVHIGYEHRVCPQCTAVNDRGETTCHRCDTPLGSRALEIAGRVGIHVPLLRSVSALLGIAIAAVYARTGLAGHGLGTIAPDVLVAYGGNLPAADEAGEWWRAATSVFLHAGLWHLGFNLLSLARIGPIVEDLYGRGVAVFLFMATGIAGALATRAWGLDGVGIGASGAILGFIGAAAVGGHRLGTSYGRALRAMALRWVVYVAVFGYFVGADNVAHAGGLVAGALFAAVVPSLWITRGGGRRLGVALGALGAIGAIATVIAAMVPLSSPRIDDTAVWSEIMAQSPDPGDLDDVLTQAFVCDRRERGDREAVAYFGEAVLAEVCAGHAALRAACAKSDGDRPTECEELRPLERLQP